LEEQLNEKTIDTTDSEAKDQINVSNHSIHEIESSLSLKEKNLENLKMSETAYHDIIENMQNGFAYHEIIVEDGIPCDFIFLDVNKAYEEIIGLNRELIVGKRITEALPGIEGELKEWLEIFGKVALGGKSTTLEQYSAALNKWFSVNVFSPSVGYFVTLFFDITLQIDEKKVFETEASMGKIHIQRLENILNSTGVGIYSLDINGKVTHVYPAAAKMLGYEINELLGKEIDTLIQQKGNILTFKTTEEIFQRKDGTQFPVEYASTPIRDDESEIIGMVVAFLDITKRKKAEKTVEKDEPEPESEGTITETQFNALLAASEARFKNLFGRMEKEIEKSQKIAQMYLDIVDVTMIACDSSGRVTLINKKGCEILGYEEEEIIGMNWFDTVIPEGKRADEKGKFEQLMTGEIKPDKIVENVIETKSREERNFSWRNKIMFDENEKIIGILSSGMDITNLKRSREALRQFLP
jgi:PAS domain S-box-containing protein